MSDRKVVLCVDDNAQNLSLLSSCLQDIYDVAVAEDGESCLKKIQEIKPDIILMDVRMPGMDGYETCSRIRALDEGNDIPVLFFSAYTSIDDKIKGYEAGGDDYISKPFDIEVVLAKVNSHLQRYSSTVSLKQELDDVTLMGINALLSTSELETIVEFTKQSLESHTFKDVVDNIFQAFDHYGLLGCAQLRSESDAFNYSPSGELAPLEIEIFNVFVEQESVVHFSNKSIFNRENISILVKNMPVGDTKAYKRVKDQLEIIVNCADSRLNAIFSEKSKAEHLKNLSVNVIEDIQADLKHLDEHFKEFEKASMAIMDDLRVEMNDTILGLCLNEDQEKKLQAMIDDANRDMVMIMQEEMELDSYIDNITHKISKSLDS